MADSQVPRPEAAEPPIPRPSTANVATATLVATLTLGVGWLAWLRPELDRYQCHSNARGSHATTWYWAFTVTLILTIFGFVVGIVFLVVGTGLFLSIAGSVPALFAITSWLFTASGLAMIITGTVFGYQILRQRDAIAEQRGVSITTLSAAWMTLIWFAALLCGYTLIGLIVAIPLAVVFFALFFRGHNQVVRAVESAGGTWA